VVTHLEKWQTPIWYNGNSTKRATDIAKKPPEIISEPQKQCSIVLSNSGCQKITYVSYLSNIKPIMLPYNVAELTWTFMGIPIKFPG
jgi:hypothetical protein